MLKLEDASTIDIQPDDIDVSDTVTIIWEINGAGNPRL
jgi:hypothetical protein